MKLLLIALLLLLSSVPLLQAQRSTPFNLQLQNLYSGESIDVFDLRSKDIEGSLYWNEEWAQGTVKLKNGGKVDKFPIRYDLMGQGLEIFLGSDIKLLSGGSIEEFYIIMGERLYHFVDLPSFFDYDGFGDGFFEVKEQGRWSLLLKSEIEVLQPNYVVALDAGNQSQTAVRKDFYYFFYEGELIRLPKQKKKFIKALLPYIPEIESIVAEIKLKPKSETSLVELAELLNTESD